MSLRVLLVDDHASFRAIAVHLLRAAGYDVVGEAQDGHSGLLAAAELRPDVVLLDIRLPDMDGFEMVERLRNASHVPDVVLISSREAADYGRRILESEARGFIAKADLSAESLAALLN